MTLTLGNWVFLIVLWLIISFCVILGVLIVEPERPKISIVVGLLVVFIFSMFLGAFLSWSNTHTASGIRAYKDFQSELSNGIDREITITAEDGREIFHYEGKVDIESNHEDNYIKFEGEDGRRYMIYYGIQDTIQIIEKEK